MGEANYRTSDHTTKAIKPCQGPVNLSAEVVHISKNPISCVMCACIEDK